MPNVAQAAMVSRDTRTIVFFMEISLLLSMFLGLDDPLFRIRVFADPHWRLRRIDSMVCLRTQPHVRPYPLRTQAGID
jgi:hypothetical protein